MNAARLIVQQGPIPNQTHALTDSPMYIGRSADNQIVINDAEISRRHARLVRRLEEDAGRYWIEDLGSTNGTFVNGLRCVGLTPLKDGDVIELGESVRLRFRDTAVSLAEEEDDEFDTADLPVVPPPPPAAEEQSYAPPPDAAPGNGAQSWLSDRRVLIGCGCAALLLLCLCSGTVLFLDQYRGGALLYCGSLRPFFEVVLGPFGFSPICP